VLSCIASALAVQLGKTSRWYAVIIGVCTYANECLLLANAMAVRYTCFGSAAEIGQELTNNPEHDNLSLLICIP